MGGLDRYPGEDLPDWIGRVAADPLFDGGSVGDIANACRCSAQDVRQVQRQLRSPLRAVWDSAIALSRRSGTPPVGVLFAAIEMYAAELRKRGK